MRGRTPLRCLSGLGTPSAAGSWGWRGASNLLISAQCVLSAVGRSKRCQMKDRGFGWTVEMQAKAVARGVRIIEVPVGYRARRLGKSKVSGTVRGTVLAGSTILSTLAKVWWREGLGRKIDAPRGQTGLWWASMLLLLAGA